MLTQRSLKRLLVLSTIEDVGFLLLGVASKRIGTRARSSPLHSRTGQGAALHLPRRARSRRRAQNRARSSRRALPGQRLRIPLRHAGHARHSADLGFIGRWRLYSTAFEIGPWPLTIFISRRSSR
jgi:hypothetical protein